MPVTAVLPAFNAPRFDVPVTDNPPFAESRPATDPVPAITVFPALLTLNWSTPAAFCTLKMSDAPPPEEPLTTTPVTPDTVGAKTCAPVHTLEFAKLMPSGLPVVPIPVNVAFVFTVTESGATEITPPLILMVVLSTCTTPSALLVAVVICEPLTDAAAAWFNVAATLLPVDAVAVRRLAVIVPAPEGASDPPTSNAAVFVAPVTLSNDTVGVLNASVPDVSVVVSTWPALPCVAGKVNVNEPVAAFDGCTVVEFAFVEFKINVPRVVLAVPNDAVAPLTASEVAVVAPAFNAPTFDVPVTDKPALAVSNPADVIVPDPVVRILPAEVSPPMALIWLLNEFAPVNAFAAPNSATVPLPGTVSVFPPRLSVPPPVMDTFALIARLPVLLLPVPP